jgi:hypothetical protein
MKDQDIWAHQLHTKNKTHLAFKLSGKKIRKID